MTLRLPRLLLASHTSRTSESADPCTSSLREAKGRLGTTLRGKWKLERLLGVGGMGAVYEARHRNGLRGAVKILDPALARSDDCHERFLREGRLANEVGHVGAVRVLDDDATEDGSAFLVMELLDGVTLEQLAMMRGGVLPPEEVARYAAQVLDTLIAAHARGIVHRDIKPENLFLTEDGIVKIVDFGIARMYGDGPRVTRAGEPVGTPAFMSPEQASGRLDDVDARTDLYSLGATMFNLVTGEPIHPDAISVAELIALVIARPARSVKEAGPVPGPLAGVIDCALAFDKDARFASAAEMRAALEAAYRKMTNDALPATPLPEPITLPPPAPVSVRRILRSRAVRRIASVLAPCTVAAACLVVVGTKADPQPPAMDAADARPSAMDLPLAPLPIPPTAPQMACRRDDSPPANPAVSSISLAARREETADLPWSRATSTPNVSRLSRWSPLYERRR